MILKERLLANQFKNLRTKNLKLRAEIFCASYLELSMPIIDSENAIIS